MPDVAIIGLGFVGGAMFRSFKEKDVNVFGFDKFKKHIDIGPLENSLDSEIIFLCLPTLFDEIKKAYNKTAIQELCNYLDDKEYNGTVVIKSTVEPQTINKLCDEFTNLNIVHNPEFLTARTAYNDFHNQTHIVLGRSKNCTNECFNILYSFYARYYPRALISCCSSDESECMKIFVNTFYSTKIQIFNEFYLLCQNMKVDYNRIKDLMLKNTWFTPHHTHVPGPDGKLSYGGACFPKDTSALLEHMKKLNSPHMVLESVVNERKTMRPEEYNVTNNITDNTENNNIIAEPRLNFKNT